MWTKGCHGHCFEWPCLHRYFTCPRKAVGMASLARRLIFNEVVNKTIRRRLPAPAGANSDAHPNYYSPRYTFAPNSGNGGDSLRERRIGSAMGAKLLAGRRRVGASARPRAFSDCIARGANGTGAVPAVAFISRHANAICPAQQDATSVGAQSYSVTWNHLHEILFPHAKPFRYRRLPRSQGVNIIAPYWFLVPAAWLLAAAPWIRWSTRFSLRALMIATTLVAIALGIYVRSGW